jgi:putative membrane protein
MMLLIRRGFRFGGAQLGSSADLRASLAIAFAGVLLWWLSRYHVASLPAWAPWDFSFSWFFATAFPLWWYKRGLDRTAPVERPALWRSASFLLGMGAIYAVLQTRFDYLAQHMFFLNRLQHVVMHHFGPFFISLAWPWRTILRGMPDSVRRLTASRPVERFLKVMRQPLLAAFLFVGLIALWLVPAIHFRAMIDPKLYLVMNWSMVGDGLLFWSIVLDPRDKAKARLSFGVRAALAIGVMFPQILIGAIIALSRRDLYTFYEWCGRIYPSIGPLDDQNYGGLIVWIPPAMMSVVSLLLVLNALRLSEERAERLAGR